MILKTKDFSSVCKIILGAIDNKESSLFTETLELKTEGDILNLNVTNREYFVKVSFKLDHEEQFHASVNASLFLNLISKVTTDTIEIVKNNNYINIRANGNYKLPVIFSNNSMLELPRIVIENVTNEMTINSSILHSILAYNSKELLRGVAARPVQKYYYIDENGAITFTSGACVNNFTLEKPIKILLAPKVVNLFKLFKEDTPVSFKMGQDALTEDLIQTKVEFSADNIVLTAKLSDLGLVSSVPISAIRGMADKNYTYSVVLNKVNLLQALGRILLFNEKDTIGSFEFSNDSVVIYDTNRENMETVKYENECTTLGSYTMGINLSSFKLILDGIEDEYVTINFGDHKAVVVKKISVSDIIPERN